MGIAAVAAQIVGSIQDGTPYPMAIGMSLCAAAALISALVAIRHSGRKPSASEAERPAPAAQQKALAVAGASSKFA